jgi:hypothetical protein
VRRNVDRRVIVVLTSNIVVAGDQPPTITCPDPIIQSNDVDQCGAVVTFEATPADDMSGVTYSCTPASNSYFSVGTTEVNCTATDHCFQQTGIVFCCIRDVC